MCAQSCLTLCDPMECSPARLLCLWDSPGKNTGVVCHFLFQGNLPDSGIEPMSLASPALAGGFFTTCTWEKQDIKKYVDIYIHLIITPNYKL